ncbi:hypothetical protein CBL_00660 [Carabus blaptoides fortunei]
MNEELILDSNSVNYSLKNDQDADSLINVLKCQLQNYKNKNNQYEQVLSKLKVTPENLSFSARDTLKTITKLQDATGVHKLNSIDIELSYLDHAVRRQKYQNESIRIKEQLDDLSQIEDSVNEENKNVEKEIILAKSIMDNMLPISQNEQRKLQLQVKSYEEKLLQYINKYPWLSSPEYNMLSVQKEIKKLYQLQHEVDKLKLKTECYCGLSQDMLIAKNHGNIYNAVSSTGTGQIIDPIYPYTVPQELPNAPHTNVENIPGGLSYTFSNVTFPYSSNPNNLFNPNQTYIINNPTDSPAFKTYAVSPNVDPIVMIQQQIANKKLEQQQLENTLLQEKLCGTFR